MPYRKETGNEYLWKQMGFELEAVRLLLIGIVCDEKYHLMIPKTVMKDLDNSIRYLGKFRENAELRIVTTGFLLCFRLLTRPPRVPHTSFSPYICHIYHS